MNITPEQIKALIEADIADAQVSVSGDGRHFEATVISPAFAGLSRVKQHQLVYASLGQRMATEEIHALSITTQLPGAAHG
ncbi:BolA/IbaG family iron-sulfur metabolism protein [Candidatus Venteria ishoeyi]|uniref:BolA-like protein n=2 Tax=Candidatus Venteria ishoeyi TaxID=1899563 RepID=A0A1H6FAY2_9GAMM|nr:BolA/IbaG family iron-sulfur metabolism protein [Candidatus Venteria ishoeyi]SEH07260.1 BolA-like protein [Candidatus Venteria ishoeyi]